MKLRFNIMEWVISLLLILNYGFVNVVLPMGLPLPIFYIFSFIYLGLNHKTSSIKGFFSQKELWILLPVVLIWSVHFIYGLFDWNLYVLRDSMHIFDFSFLLFGWAYASTIKLNKYVFEKFIKSILIINSIYVLFRLIPGFLVSISPTFGAFNKVSLLGSFAITGIISLVAIFYFRDSKSWFYKILSLTNFLMIFVLQGRFLYFALALILPLYIYFIEIKKYSFNKSLDSLKLFKTIFAVVIFGIVALSLISISDISIEGRHGVLSGDLLKNEVLSMVGKGNLEGPAKGVHQRLDWWSSLFKESFSNVSIFFFGKGVGMPLTDFYVSENTVVREPHNSYITTFLRYGFIGFIGFLIFHIRFIKLFLRRKNLSKIDLSVFLFYILSLGNAMVQPVFEFSYFAAPIYFFIGYYMFKFKKEDLKIEHSS